MPSAHDYTSAELPCSHSPHGLAWIVWRLESAGYHFVSATQSATDTFRVEVGEANVSKNQMLFDMQPADGQLACNFTSLNVAPPSTRAITITGPVGKEVKVRFSGVCFLNETEFTIPGNNNHNFVLGPCPSYMRVVEPQLVDFYVEDGSCSPVAVLVTFK